MLVAFTPPPSELRQFCAPRRPRWAGVLRRKLPARRVNEGAGLEPVAEAPKQVEGLQVERQQACRLLRSGRGVLLLVGMKGGRKFGELSLGADLQAARLVAIF